MPIERTNDGVPVGRAIAAGDRAPDFSLKTGDGNSIRLANVVRDKAVVLFFYPRDFSPVCTKEACAFRDQFSVFNDAGATVIGISSDDVESHKNFAVEHKLPFPLLSDADGAVRKAFGVPKAMLLLPGRTTYVIDRERMVRHVFTAHLSSEAHVKAALEVVQQLAKK